MRYLPKRTALFCAALLGSTTFAMAQGMLADKAGMTLYIFDKDTDGVSTCYDDCAVKWPPYVGTAGETMGEDWTLIPRTDGTMQWAHKGKPVYLFQGDTNAGDATGDGVGGVWHVIKE